MPVLETSVQGLHELLRLTDGAPVDLLASADLMVWLDLPRVTVLRQVTARTVVRRLRRGVVAYSSLSE